MDRMQRITFMVCLLLAGGTESSLYSSISRRIQAFALQPSSRRRNLQRCICSALSSVSIDRPMEASLVSRSPNLKNPPLLTPEQWPKYEGFSFTIHSEDSRSAARLGTLSTPHGVVETPAFIFCATKAAIKGLTMDQMRACGTQIVLSNTYHLYVQPGADAMRAMGGVQKATNWRGPMLTDSGGYQIFSMGHGSVSDEIKGRRSVEAGEQRPKSLLSIGEKGARFKSYFDGSIKSLSPETSIQIQRSLGADIILVLDECTPFHVDKEYTAASTRRSHRWALRSLNEFVRSETEDLDKPSPQQALYGIVQGGVYEDLRRESTAFCNETPFFGTAVGGSLGGDKGAMYKVIEMTLPLLRRDRPIHLLGIGGIADVFHGVRWGVDTFDCVHPTRLGRHGGALVKASYWKEAAREGKPTKPKENILLERGMFKLDQRPIDPDCGCPTCTAGYTRAYLQHLLSAGELLGGTLISQHNVYFMNKLFSDIREALRTGVSLDVVEAEYLVPELRADRFTLDEKKSERTRVEEISSAE